MGNQREELKKTFLDFYKILGSFILLSEFYFKGVLYFQNILWLALNILVAEKMKTGS